MKTTAPRFVAGAPLPALLLIASTVVLLLSAGSGCSTTPKDRGMPHEISLYAAAMQAISQQKWAEARPLIEELLRIDPEPGDHALLAAVLVGEGRIEDAFAELSLVIEQAPTHPEIAELSESLRGDDIWKPLRADPRFEPLAERADRMRWKPDFLRFDDAPPFAAWRTRCSGRANPYLATLRERYGLDAVIAGASDDLDRVKRVTHWVHARTGHTGWPDGQPTDPLGLLDAAAKGASFRCVEFGIAVAGSLNAVGIPARVVGAKTRDVETRRLGAGHVFAEAWLPDREKWVFVDAQLDIVGQAKDGTPLNAIEFRNALAGSAPPVAYSEVLSMCMYYFDYGADERFPQDSRERTRWMVGPIGSTAPTKFQRMPWNAPDGFSNRAADPYAPPIIEP